jgi:hypothetical protein
MIRRRAIILTILSLAISGAMPPARADVVSMWNEKAGELLPKMGKQGPYVLRGLTMMHAAMFDAVNAIEQQYAPLKVDLRPPPGASPEAAAAGAARRILLELVPQERKAINAEFRATMEGVAESDATRRGAAFGEDVAVKIALWRTEDGSERLISYVPHSGPGLYAPTSTDPMIAPHWGQVVPWTMTSGHQFRPGPPPALDSVVWRRDVEETKAVGGKDSTARTSEQTNIARFHSQAEFPVWNAIARRVVAEHHLTLGASARLFALLNVAMADAHIAVYDAKYTYSFWRPVTAIHAGSAGIVPDPRWESLILAPMHPEYPCAHCTLGAAAQVVMEAAFGPAVSFQISTSAMPDAPRDYPSIAAFAEEEAYSRILGGIHYRNSWNTGAALGRKIGEQAVAGFMQPRS